MNLFNTFLSWEQTTHDTIDFKCAYVDMAGDLVSGLLLSQIVYWHLPNQETGKTKLRVEKDGHLWVAKNRDDWWKEIRITAKQVDRAIKVLSSKGLIVHKNSLFAGKRTPLIRIDPTGFMAAWNEQTEIRVEDRYLPEVNIGIDQRVEPITESTSESTSIHGRPSATTSEPAASSTGESSKEEDISAPKPKPPVQQPEPAPPAPKTSTPQTPAQRTQAQQTFEALALVCAIGISKGALTEKQRGILNKESNKLRTVLKATPRDILGFKAYWFDNDWRGQRDQWPQPHQVREEWEKYQRWRARSSTTRIVIRPREKEAEHGY